MHLYICMYRYVYVYVTWLNFVEGDPKAPF